MKKFLLLFLAVFLFKPTVLAQSAAQAGGIERIQQSQSAVTIPQSTKAPDPLQVATKDQADERRELKIPAGTTIEVEVAYTVGSIDVKPGELLSFRVLIPVIIDGVTAIEKGALVTARVTEAKRGGHWGKAGRLAWSMQDVIAADNTRIPLAAETTSRNDKLWSLETGGISRKSANVPGSVKGTSHGAEVATKTIVAAAIFPPLAPLALMQGFRRGENAILPEGKRFVVVVPNETSVTVMPKN